MQTIAKNTICLWFDKDALDAATFYADTFPDSSVDAVHRAPGCSPSVALVQMGGGQGTGIGNAGGYGGIYCFALKP